MGKKLLIGFGMLLLLAAGIAVGMYAQFNMQVGFAQAVTQPFLAMVEGDAKPAPPMDHWHYPGAKVISSGKGAGLTVNGHLIKPASEYVVLATTEDYAKVAEHYGVKLGIAEAAQLGQQLGGGSVGNSTAAGYQLVQADGLEPVTQKPRPVRTLCLRQTCVSYDVVVFLSRAEQEAHTHIVLLYEPRPVRSGS